MNEFKTKQVIDEMRERMKRRKSKDACYAELQE